MLVQFDVPEEMARQFAAEPGGIARAATEALAVEGVRSGKLTVYQARQLLGITSRYEMDGFLKSHGVRCRTPLSKSWRLARLRSPAHSARTVPI